MRSHSRRSGAREPEIRHEHYGTLDARERCRSALRPGWRRPSFWRDVLGRLGAIGRTHSIGCRELFRALRDKRRGSACLLLLLRPERHIGDRPWRHAAAVAGARRGPVPCRVRNYSSLTCTLPIAVTEVLASMARFKRPVRSMSTFPECTKGRQWDHGRRSQLQVILQASWNGFWLRR